MKVFSCGQRVFLPGVMAIALFCATHAAAASTVVTWGTTNNYGLGVIPASLTNAVAIAGGLSHSLALKADGRVVAWGDNFSGQTNVPAGLTNVMAIAAAWNHCVTLRSNGTVVAWGTGGTNVPAGLSNVVAIAAGDNFSLALRADGTLSAWGSDLYSPTNVPADLKDVVGITAGGSFGVALKCDGRVITWNSSPPSTVYSNTAAVAAGEFPLVFLKSDGTAFVTSGPQPPAGSSNLVAVAAGRYYPMMLKADGTVVMGSGTPAVPAGLTNVTAIAAGQEHFLALIGDGPPFLTAPLLNRTVAPGANVPFYMPATGTRPLAYQWQSNGTNIPGATNVILSLTNVLPDRSGNFSVIVTNNFGSVTSAVAALTVLDFSGALNTTGLVWTTYGDAPWFIETNVTHDGVSALQSGAVSGNQSSVVQTTVTGPGTLTFWWKSSVYASNLRLLINNVLVTQSSNNTNWLPVSLYLGSGTQVLKWVLVAAATGQLDEVRFIPGATAPIFTSTFPGQSQAPGLNALFQASADGTPPIGFYWLLNGTNIPGATTPSLSITNLQTSNLGTYTLVATNLGGTNSFSAGLAFGQIAQWIDESHNPGVFYEEVAPPYGMTNVVAVAAGYLHNVALKSDQSIVTWAASGTPPMLEAPADLTNAISVAAGYGFSAALKADGTVAAWGDNSSGTTNIPPGLSNVVALAAGWYQLLALKSDGTVVTWGYLGPNTPAGLSNVVAVAGGAFHSLALTDSGLVVGWGEDNYGALDMPADLTNAIGIAAGYFYSSAIRSGGTVVTWGDNRQSQTNIPVGLNNAILIGKGVDHSLAITAAGVVTPADTYLNIPVVLTNGIMVSGGFQLNLALLGNSPPMLQSPLTHSSMGTGGFSVSLAAESGRVYRLEYTTSLFNPNWTALPLVAGRSGTLVLTDPSATSAQQRFYRVRRW